MAMAAVKNVDRSEGLGQMVEKAREASEFLKALSHESRLLLLCILAEGECSVSELEGILGERQSTVSQQLARLRLDRLVATRRDGKTIYYSLANDDVRTILQALYSVFCAPGTKGKRKSLARDR
jgi:DNA-binding transcriptional ArsR family regulator